MSEAKEESKFGFKDKAKAEETLKNLEEHDMAYRKLTVRGLLGRAKRVLLMTKAEDKINNISAAIKVFESWIEENQLIKSVAKEKEQEKSTASSQKADDTNAGTDKVPGLGYKDKAAAEATLKNIDGRDPSYQMQAIKGLIGSAQRTLHGTKDQKKLDSMAKAIDLFEKFLDQFNKENRIRDNLDYLALSVVHKLAAPTNELASEFLTAYEIEAKGNYKFLRTLYPKDNKTLSWDIVRNRKLTELLEKIKREDHAKMFDKNGMLTAEHLELISWAYSPEPVKTKKLAELSPRKSAHKESDDEDEPLKKRAK